MIATADTHYPTDFAEIDAVNVDPALRAVTIVLEYNAKRAQASAEAAGDLLKASGKEGNLPQTFEAPTVTDKDAAARAYVNHGRWVVECPFGCGEAQLASRVDRRYFCTKCRNQAVGGSFATVVWPTEKAVADAETILLRRPILNRNWSPEREPVEQLADENAAAGIH